MIYPLLTGDSYRELKLNYYKDKHNWSRVCFRVYNIKETFF